MKKSPKTTTLNKNKRGILIAREYKATTGRKCRIVATLLSTRRGERILPPHTLKRATAPQTFLQVPCHHTPKRIMKSSKKTSKTVSHTTSFTPIPTAEIAIQVFQNEVAKEKEESQSGCIAKFIACMSALTSTKRSFTINDAYAEARPFELHNADIKYLFSKWCEVNQALGRIEILENGCYDEPLVIMAV